MLATQLIYGQCDVGISLVESQTNQNCNSRNIKLDLTLVTSTNCVGPFSIRVVGNTSSSYTNVNIGDLVALDQLRSGPYYFEICDSNNFCDIHTINIESNRDPNCPIDPTIPCDILFESTTSNITACGANDGTIQATIIYEVNTGGSILFSLDGVGSANNNTTGAFTGLAPGSYTVYVWDSSDPSCSKNYSYFIEDFSGCGGCMITGATITADQTICSGDTPSSLFGDGTSGSTSPTGSGTLSHQWQSSESSTTTGYANISGAVSLIYSPPTLTQTTYYRLISNSDQGCADTSNVVTVTVEAPVTPTFTQLGPYCVGDSPDALPTVSTNGVSGSWSPSTISTAAAGSTTYSFTPSSGECAIGTMMEVVVDAPITAMFNQLGPYCVGDSPDALPTVSTNGVTGSWSPSTISTATAGSTTYSFTPSAGECAIGTMMEVVVEAPVTPTFTQLGPYCVGDTPDALPTTSDNGVNGTWDPSTISTMSAGVTNFTFTPADGECAEPAMMEVDVDAPVTPTFTQLGPYCVGDSPDALPTTSDNGVSGTWDPSTISTMSAGVTNYTFTPANGECAESAMMEVTVDAPVTPTFTQLGPYCLGDTPDALPTTSDNGVSGTWDPSTISTMSSGTVSYTFTPANGECAESAIMEVTINPLPVCVLEPGVNLSICEGEGISVMETGGDATMWSWTGPNGFSSSSSSISIPSAIVADSGEYKVIITDVNGCVDSCSIVIDVNRMPPMPMATASGDTKSFCVGESDPNNRKLQISVAGDVTDTDTIIWIPISLPAGSIEGVDYNIVSDQGQRLSFINYPTPGLYDFDVYIESEDMCTSDTINLSLTVLDTSQFVIDTLICPGASFTFNDQEITAAGTYLDTLINTVGCDSFLTLVVNVGDTSKPEILVPSADLLVSCDAIAYPDDPVVFDDCGIQDIIRDSSILESCGLAKTIEYIFAITDVGGNVCRDTSILTIQDITPPVFIFVPNDSIVDCSDISYPMTPTAMDNCGVPTITRDSIITPGSCPQNYTINYTFTGIDSCDNRTAASMLLTVQDTTKPVFTTVPSDGSVSCDNISYPAMPTAMDDCGVLRIDRDSTITPTCGVGQMIEYIFTAVDSCMNMTMVMVSWEIEDTQAPIFTVMPADTTVGCDAIPPVGTVETSDNCNAVTVTFSESAVAGSCTGEQTIMRTWTATDACGLLTDYTQTITVVDTVAPSIACPAPLVIMGCSMSDVPATTHTAVSDNCDGAPTVTQRDEVTGTSCDTIFLSRYFIAEDDCGNKDSCIQLIKIVDDIPPVIGVAQSSLEISCEMSIPPSGATVMDNCSDAADITIIERLDTLETICPGSIKIERTITAADTCDNVDSIKQQILQLDKSEPFFVVAPADTTVSCDGVPPIEDVVVGDDCSGTTIDTSYERILPSIACSNEYEIERVWRAIDSCGNVDSVIQVISVIDTLDPVFVDFPADTTVNCDATAYLTTVPTLMGQDQCNNLMTTATFQSEQRINGMCEDSYQLIRTWSLTDECGNKITQAQVITVQDTVAPTFSESMGSLDVMVTCDDSYPDPLPAPTPLDNCDSDIALSIVSDVTIMGDDPVDEIRTLRYVAEDNCTNVSDTFDVVITTYHQPIIFGDDITICIGETVDLETLTNGVFYGAVEYGTSFGSYPDTITTIVSPTVTTTYFVRDSFGVSGCVDTAQITVTVNPLPVLMAVEDTLCVNDRTVDLRDYEMEMSSETDVSYTYFTNGGLVSELFISEYIEGSSFNKCIEIFNGTASPIDLSPYSLAFYSNGNTSPSTMITLSGVVMSGDVYVVCDDGSDPEFLAVADLTPSNSFYNGDDAIVLSKGAVVIDVIGQIGNDPGSQWGSGDQSTENNTLVRNPAILSGDTNPNDAFDPSLEWTGFEEDYSDDLGRHSAHVKLPIFDPSAITVEDLDTFCVVVTNDMTGCVDSTTLSFMLKDTSHTDLFEDICQGDSISFGGDMFGDAGVYHDTLINAVGCDSFVVLTLNVLDTSRYEYTEQICDNDSLLFNGVYLTVAGNYRDTMSNALGCDSFIVLTLEILPTYMTEICDTICTGETYLFVDQMLTTAGMYIDTVAAANGCDSVLMLELTVDPLPVVMDAYDSFCAEARFDRNLTLYEPQITSEPATFSYEILDGMSYVPVPDPNDQDVDPRNEYRVTVISTVTGCMDTATLILEVVDDEKPVFSNVPVDTTVNCDDISYPINPSVSDNCEIIAYTRDSSIVEMCGESKEITYVFTAEDSNGNICRDTTVLTIQDTVAPIFTWVAADSILDCDAFVEPARPVVMDNCGELMTFTVDIDTTDMCGQTATYVYTYTAIDSCGLVTDTSITWISQDTTKPVFTFVPSDSIVNCDDISYPLMPEAMDNCGLVEIQRDSTITPTCGVGHKIEYTFTAVDSCDNMTEVIVNWEIQDTVGPIFKMMPADTTVDCDAIPDVGSVETMDNCNTVSVTFDESRTDGACIGEAVILRTWTATDLCDNATSYTQTITVQDTTAPEIVCATDILLTGCDISDIPATSHTAVSDNCDSAPVVTQRDEIVGNSCDTIIVSRYFIATDACGNQDSCIQTIKIVDDQSPTISVAQSSLEISCDEMIPMAMPTLMDNCSDIASITVVERLDTLETICPNSIKIERTLIASDTCGNMDSVKQEILQLDKDVPFFLVAPADTTVSCDGIPPFADVIVNDNCGDTTIVSSSERIVAGTECNNEYEIIRVWRGEDACGNVDSVTQTLTVIDTLDPVFIDFPVDTLVDCDAIPAVPTLSGMDQCSDLMATAVFQGQQRINGICADSYQLIRTWALTDECGNQITQSQVIAVQDTIAPTFAELPGSLDAFISCDEVYPDPLPAPTPMDACDGEISLTIVSDVSLTGFDPIDEIRTLRYVAQDNCANASDTFDIVITTYHEPMITAEDITICIGETVDLEALTNGVFYGALEYGTTFGNYPDTITTMVSPTVTTTYFVRDSFGVSGCVDTAQITVTVNPLPVLMAVEDTLCVNDRTVDLRDYEMEIGGTADVSYSYFATAKSQDLYISEYVEGSSSNKCVEIYNGTGSTVDLTDYTIEIYSNGGATPNSSTALIGMLDDEDVYVICNGSTTIYTADQTTGSINFNGDDAVVLKNGAAIIDVIGQIGVDPGSQWGSGVTSTENNTLIRKANIHAGDPDGSDAFDPSIEWDGLAQDIHQLGSHTVAVTKEQIIDPSAILIEDLDTFCVVVTDNITGCIDSTTLSFMLRDTSHTDLFEEICQGDSVSFGGDMYGNTGVYHDTLINTVGCDSFVVLTLNVLDTSRYEYTEQICDNDSLLFNGVYLTAAGSYRDTMTNAVGCDSFIVLTLEILPTYLTEISETICANESYTFVDRVLTDAGIYRDTLAAANGCDSVLVLELMVDPLPEANDVYDSFCADMRTGRDLTALESQVSTDAVTFSYELRVETCPMDLFISEYVEGSSNNKCIELFNGTGATVDLSEYSIHIYANGGAIATSTISLLGMLSDQDVYVVCQTNADAGINADFRSNVLNYNGNDAVALLHDNAIIDVIGQIGADPITEWGSGVISTRDNTLRRKSSILMGDPDGSDAFDPTTEWDGFANDTFDGLGMHADPCTVNYVAVTDPTDQDVELRNEYQVIVTSTVTGCMDTATIVLEVVDDEKPIFLNTPNDTIVDCDAISYPITPDAIDNCAIVSITRDSSIIEACGDTREITYVFTVEDSNGNVCKDTTVLTIQDTVASVFSWVAVDSTLDCDDFIEPAAPIVSDNCGTLLSLVTTIDTMDACGLTASYRYTYTATDSCLNVTDTSIIWTVQDTTKPVFTFVPTDSIVNCDDISYPLMPAAMDNCGLVEIRRDSAITPTCGVGQTIEYTFTAVDSCDNMTVMTVNWEIQDTVGPIFTMMPADAIVDCDAIPAVGTVETMDNCNTVSLTFDESRTIGACIGEAVILRIWTATDLCDNTTIYTQTITVQDTTAPEIVCPADILLTGCDISDIPATSHIAVSDNCDPDPVVTQRDEIMGNSCDTIVVSRYFIATDACGNQDSCIQTIKIVDDTDPSISIAPGAVNISCAAELPSPIVTVEDNCTDVADITVTSRLDTVETICEFSIKMIRTLIGTDICGNQDSVKQEIIQLDESEPFFLIAPVDTTVNCDGVPDFDNVVVDDDCGDVIISTNEIITATGCTNEYDILRIWRATDICGNVDSVTQTITVIDTLDPVFVDFPRDTTITCDADMMVPLLSGVDQCTNLSTTAVYQGQQRINGMCADSYQLIRMWSLTDECGNEIQQSQVITVIDTVAPIWIESAGELDIFVACDQPYPNDISGPTAMDDCDDDVTITVVEDNTVEGVDPVDAIRTIQYIAMDNCENLSDTFSLTITTYHQPVISGTDITICVGESVDLEDQLSEVFYGAVKYGTTLGAYPDTITTLVSPITTTTYYVRDSFGVSGCVDTAQITVTVDPLPILIDLDIVLCAEDATAVDLTSYETQITTATGLFEYEYFAERCTESLIISEYIEGSGNNKCIEIYNGTGESIDLSSYQIDVYNNGATSPSRTIALSSILAHGDVYTVCNAGTTYTNPDLISGSINHNGDDAIALAKGATLIDVFGRIGEDPGTQWSENGVSSQNMTLIRMPSVSMGDSDGSDTFDPSAQWIAMPIDYISDLGMHTADCDTETSTVPFATSVDIIDGDQIRVTFTDAMTGCVNTSLMNFTVLPHPVVEPLMTANVCPDEFVDLSQVPFFDTEMLDGVLDTSYYTTEMDAIAGTDPLSTPIVTTSGEYFMRYSVDGCPVIVPITVTITTCGSIGSTVWIDNNNNGLIDADEIGIAGVVVTLLDDMDAVIATDTTDAAGNYYFDGLPQGTYEVIIDSDDLPERYPLSSTVTDPTEDLDGNDNGAQLEHGGTISSGSVILTDGNEPTGTDETFSAGTANDTGGMQDDARDAYGDMTVDFGLVPEMSLGSTVFVDVNDNGLQDPTDPGIPGVTVQLFDNNGNLLTTTMTDANGDYLFGWLAPGEYVVVLPTTPTDLPVSSTPTDPADNQEDNDDNGIQATVGGSVSSPVIVLTGGAEPTGTQESGQGGDQDDDLDGLGAFADANGDMTIDFGFFGPASLGDTVWVDVNYNGLQDRNEPPIEGLAVMLTDSLGNPVLDIYGDPVETVFTDADGYYIFKDLRPGDYKVTFEIPTGLEVTIQNVNGGGPGDKADDSDINESGMTVSIWLDSGEHEPDIDAGFFDPDNIIDPEGCTIIATVTDVICRTDGTYDLKYTISADRLVSSEYLVVIDGQIFDTMSYTGSPDPICIYPDVPGDEEEVSFALIAAASGGLVVTEILADPPSGDSDDEFIEIYNNSGIAIFLDGYELHDNVGLKHTFGDVVLGAGGTLVLFGDGQHGPFGPSVVIDTASTGGLGLNNTGDNLTLYDASGTIVWSYSYGTEANDDQSLVNIGWDTFVKISETRSTESMTPGVVDPSYFAFAEGFGGFICGDTMSYMEPLCEVTDTFDLAIQKLIASEGPFNPGDTVDFDLTVFNQGNVTAYDIEVRDYVPAGLIYDLSINDTDWGPDSTYVAIDSIVPDEMATVTISLIIDPALTSSDGLVNGAEVIAGYVAKGAFGEDIDGDLTDLSGGPQEIDNNETDNELSDSQDDFDFAVITFCDDIALAGPTIDDIVYCSADEVMGATTLTPVAYEFVPDLFISQYVEGSLSDKCLEIYNHTGATVDLSEYFLDVYFNGNLTASTLQLSGSLAHGETYVICNEAANAELLAISTATNSRALDFNGNDAIILRKETRIIDALGQVGNSSNYAMDIGLIRSADSYIGDANPYDVFDVSASWMSIDPDDYVDLGQHTISTAEVGSYNFYLADPASGAAPICTKVPTCDISVLDPGDYQYVWITTAVGSCETEPVRMSVTVHPGTGSLTCLGDVNVTLGPDCSLDLSPDLFYRGNLPTSLFEIAILTESGDTVSDYSQLQMTDEPIIYHFRDLCTDNYCWGYVHLEDKTIPEAVECPCALTENGDFTTAADSCKIFCLDSLIVTAPTFMDNCVEGTPAELGIDSVWSYDYASDCEIGRRTLHWIYTDEASKEKDTLCSQRYFIEPIPLDSIRMVDSLRISCDEVDLLASPEALDTLDARFGYPYFINNVGDTIRIYPWGNVCGLYLKTDDEISYQGCAQNNLILREWRLFDLCGKRDTTYRQMIEIYDDQAPEFNVIVVDFDSLLLDSIPIDSINIDSLIEVTVDLDKLLHRIDITDPWQCATDFELPIFDKLEDNCTVFEDIRYDYILPAGAYVDPDDDRLIRDLAEGVHRVTVIAIDECDNADSLDITVIVLDRAQPIVHCQEEINMSLIYEDFARDSSFNRLPVEILDDGSYDLCGDIILRLARRMDNKFLCGDDPLRFIGTEYIEFCCEDVGRTIPVELTVYDAFGNTAVCWINVRIDDKSRSVAECADVTVDCHDDLSPEHLGHPELTGYACDGEPAWSYTDVEELSSSCHTGVIYRSWIDSLSGASCTQTITVIEDERFDPTSIRWPLHYTGQRYADEDMFGYQVPIDIKTDVVVRSIDEHGDTIMTPIELSDHRISHLQEGIDMPDAIDCTDSVRAEVIYSDHDYCGLIAVSHEDLRYTVGEGDCSKILREYTVIDWCVYEPNVQRDKDNDEIILVKDKVEDELYFAFAEGGYDRDGIYHFTQTIKIIDTIAPEIVYYKPMTHSTGVDCRTEIVASFAAVDTGSCRSSTLDYTAVLVVDGDQIEQLHGQVAQGDTVTVRFDGSWPMGEYHVHWTVQDACGNQASCTQLHFVEDRLAPDAYCINSVSLSFDEDDQAVIWASDFALSTEDRCSGVDYYFLVEGAPSSSLAVSCDDMRADGSIVTTVYFEDDQANVNSCEVIIQISNPTTCDAFFARYPGQVRTVSGEAMPDVIISSTTEGRIIEELLTDESGAYSATQLADAISASYDRDPLNGISTLDLVLLQAHILGLTPIEDPYAIIAGDANDSGHLSASDLIEIRRLILGITEKYNANDSWRFVDSEEIMDMESVFPYVEQISTTPARETYNFVGVKIGDINHSATMRPVKSNAMPEMTLSYDYDPKALTLTFYADEAAAIAGYQIELTGLSEVVSMSNAAGSLANHYHLDIDGGWRISYQNVEEVSEAGSDVPLFVIELANAIDPQDIQVSDADISPELYVQRGNRYEAKAIELSARTSKSKTISYLGNGPNPFAEKNVLKFDVPEAQEVQLLIHDAIGQLVFESLYTLTPEHEEIILSKDQFNGSGMYYIQLIWGDKTVNDQILLIK